MTRGSIREYTEAVRGCYLKAGRSEKGMILNHFVKVTGYHRLAVIRLLRRSLPPRERKRRGIKARDEARFGDRHL
jgi:hypothetical protein